MIPWVRNIDGHVRMVAGPNALRLTSTIPLEGADMRHKADFTVRAGEKVPFTLTGFPSYEKPPKVDRPVPRGRPHGEVVEALVDASRATTACGTTRCCARRSR